MRSLTAPLPPPAPQRSGTMKLCRMETTAEESLTKIPCSNHSGLYRSGTAGGSSTLVTLWFLVMEELWACPSLEGGILCP